MAGGQGPTTCLAGFLCRYQTVIDAAYMLYIRAQQLQPITYWSVDSSPQGGKDWLLCIRSSISREGLMNAFAALHSLAANVLDSGSALPIESVEELSSQLTLAIIRAEGLASSLGNSSLKGPWRPGWPKH
jgi:hypothetical protein